MCVFFSMATVTQTLHLVVVEDLRTRHHPRQLWSFRAKLGTVSFPLRVCQSCTNYVIISTGRHISKRGWWVLISSSKLVLFLYVPFFSLAKRTASSLPVCFCSAAQSSIFYSTCPSRNRHTHVILGRAFAFPPPFFLECYSLAGWLWVGVCVCCVQWRKIEKRKTSSRNPISSFSIARSP